MNLGRLTTGLLCALALTGCGATSPRQAIRRMLTRLDLAVSAGDTRAACSSLLFFPPGRPRAELVGYARGLTGEGGRANFSAVVDGCRVAFAASPQRLLGGLRAVTGARLGAVRSKGPVARVTLHDRAGRVGAATFVRAAGAWRLLLGSVQAPWSSPPAGSPPARGSLG